eukprot:gene5778-7373_t
MYTSDDFYSNEVYDPCLSGAIIVTDPKAITSDMEAEHAVACDVDEEVILFLSEIDESKSRYYSENLENYLKQSQTNEPDGVASDAETLTAAYQQYLKRYSINGYSDGTYGRRVPVEVVEGTKVRWYVTGRSSGYTSKSFTLHWAGGNTLLRSKQGKNTDVLTASEGEFEILDMNPRNNGTFLITALGDVE